MAKKAPFYEMELEDYIEESCIDGEIDRNYMQICERDQTCAYHMLGDLWGEVGRIGRLLAKEEPDQRSMLCHLAVAHKVCNAIYAESKNVFDSRLKLELKIAEWDLNRYVRSGNYSDEETAERLAWFQQFNSPVFYAAYGLVRDRSRE